MTVGRPGQARSVIVFAAVLLAAAATLLLGSAEAAASARTTATVHAKGELIETMPIGRSAWEKPQVVMSIKPKQIGELKDGDRIEATGEVELTTCLKPTGGHPGQPCVGEMYGYDPNLKAKLIVAPTAGSTNGTQLGRQVKVKCVQEHPNRNHHCVLSVPWGGNTFPSTGQLPCGPGSCFVNMVASAHHGSARDGEKVVVGSSDDNKRIHQGLSKLSAVRFRPGKAKPSRSWRGGRATKKAPVVSKNGRIKREVIYSAKVSRLKAGDQLVVDALMKNRIGHLPYNVFHRTEVVFAKRPKQTTAYGKVLGTTGRLSASNGFNCTQGRSGHSDVCTIRKGGVLSVKKNARGPFYVNFVVGQHAIGTSNRVAKWGPRHRSRVQKGGYVKVERYSGAGVCPTCTTGWTNFSPSERPSTEKPSKLVAQLARWGITQGAYDCGGRPAPVHYVCNWRSQGRFGDSPRYECEKKAQWWKKGRSFVIKPCKEAMGAQLWNELLKMQPRLGIEPTFAGVCKERPKNRYRCKYHGDGIVEALLNKSCKGYGTYNAKSHSWSITACRVGG